MKTKMLSCPASVIMKLKGVYTPHSPHRSHPWIKVAPWRKQHVSSFEKSDLRREKCHPAPLKKKSCVHFYNWPTLKLHTRDASSDPLKLSFVNLIMIISKSANVHAIDPPPLSNRSFPPRQCLQNIQTIEYSNSGISNKARTSDYSLPPPSMTETNPSAYPAKWTPLINGKDINDWGQ